MSDARRCPDGVIATTSSASSASNSAQSAASESAAGATPSDAQPPLEEPEMPVRHEPKSRLGVLEARLAALEADRGPRRRKKKAAQYKEPRQLTEDELAEAQAREIAEKRAAKAHVPLAAINRGDFGEGVRRPRRKF